MLEINGRVGKIVLTGNFDGEIVLTGTGKVDAVETGEGLSGEPSVRLEGDLQVESLNGRPAARPTAPSSPSPGPSNPPAPPAPQPEHPSVTEAVYTAFADYVEFKLETSDAEKVYYAAWDATFAGPDDAETLKDWVASGSGPMGTADASGGKAAITVTGLDEDKNYVLYAAAEAPDGTLSELYDFPFKTEPVNIVGADYSVQPLDDDLYQLHFVVQLNTKSVTPVYWRLIDRQIHPYPEDVVSGCGGSDGEQCGSYETRSGTGTTEFMVVVPAAGTYYLYATAMGNQLSPVYALEVKVQASPLPEFDEGKGNLEGSPLFLFMQRSPIMGCR